MIEEIFDITDANGIPTGKTITRSEAHKQGIMHRSAHVWIIRKAGGSYQILLQKRSANKDSFPSMYDTSSAGHVQAGDEPLESAQRELFEELGIKAAAEDLHFVGTFHVEYSKQFHGKMFNDNEIAFVYVYEKPVDETKLALQAEEVESVKWFDLKEIQASCIHRNETKKSDGIFCVPIKGFETIMTYLEHNK